MSAITNAFRLCSKYLFSEHENNDLKNSPNKPIHSFRNKDGILVELCSVKKELDFSEDRKLFLKIYPGFESKILKWFENGSEYLDKYFNDMEKNIQEQNAIYLRAFSHNKLIGWASYNLNWKKNEPNWEKSLYLEHIYIDPEFQNKGVGKELLFSVLLDSEIISHFNSIVVLTEWYTLNKPERFYEKIGFQKITSTDFNVKGNLYKWEFT